MNLTPSSPHIIANNPLPLLFALDPRPEAEARKAPYEGVVNIPLEELSDRVYELPPPHELLQICGPTDLRTKCVELLRKMGRNAEPCTSFKPGEVPTKGRLWRPNKTLESLAPTLTLGKAIDLGCGSGRDAVYLASIGWEVLAIDRLTDALENARRLASRYLDSNVPEFICADILKGGIHIAGADLVYAIRFFDGRLGRLSHQFLKRGGLFLVETFSEEHRVRFGKPSASRVVPSELGEVLCREDWEIIEDRFEERPEERIRTVLAKAS